MPRLTRMFLSVSDFLFRSAVPIFLSGSTISPQCLHLFIFSVKITRAFRWRDPMFPALVFSFSGDSSPDFFFSLLNFPFFLLANYMWSPSLLNMMAPFSHTSRGRLSLRIFALLSMPETSFPSPCPGMEIDFSEKLTVIPPFRAPSRPPN